VNQDGPKCAAPIAPVGRLQPGATVLQPLQPLLQPELQLLQPGLQPGNGVPALRSKLRAGTPCPSLRARTLRKVCEP